MTRLLNHVRHNVIAYLALFVALGGTGYAAVSLPNGSITASKLNRHSIGGYVVAWAYVRHDGHVLAGSPGAAVAGPAGTTYFYFVHWRGVKFTTHCAPFATMSQVGPHAATAVRAFIANAAGRVPAQVGVVPTDPGDNSQPADFYVEVIC